MQIFLMHLTSPEPLPGLVNRYSSRAFEHPRVWLMGWRPVTISAPGMAEKHSKKRSIGRSTNEVILVLNEA